VSICPRETPGRAGPRGTIRDVLVGKGELVTPSR
jgi:hypothetical protein